ncbi:MAG: DUF2157 domain-containing protein [Shewanella xiamenensis]|nr:DUF2157 domain-containing protein [Shewanella xiamenensis]MCD8560851.1 DUF2157 domain-containing protein [Shewanella xiamenensis]
MVSPNSLSWQRLLSLLLQWAGALSLVTGIIFFFAYNWQSALFPKSTNNY